MDVIIVFFFLLLSGLFGKPLKEGVKAVRPHFLQGKRSGLFCF
jgi:hypothetical protein